MGALKRETGKHDTGKRGNVCLLSCSVFIENHIQNYPDNFLVISHSQLMWPRRVGEASQVTGAIHASRRRVRDARQLPSARTVRRRIGSDGETDDSADEDEQDHSEQPGCSSSGSRCLWNVKFFKVCLIQVRDARAALVPCGHQRFCASCMSEIEAHT